MNGMTDEERERMDNPEMSGEAKVYMLKRIVYREVFRFKDLSEEEAERDVIVRRAIASGLVPVRLDGESKEAYEARQAITWRRLVKDEPMVKVVMTLSAGYSDARNPLEV